MKLRLLQFPGQWDDAIGRGFIDSGWDVKFVFDGFFNEIKFLREHGHEFDAVHFRPRRSDIQRVRYELDWLGLPHLIESVSGIGLAPLGKGTVMFCGSMFGGPAEHTLFESNIGITPPALACQHDKEPWHNDSRYHFGKYLARELATFFVTPY